MVDNLTILIAVIEPLAFFVIALLAARAWRRRPDTAGAWLTATFVMLALTTVIGGVIPLSWEGGLVEQIRRFTLVFLLLFPYCLYRFTGAFVRRPAAKFDVVALALTAFVTVPLPFIPTPKGAVPLWVNLYLLAMLADWMLLTVVAARRLWRSSRGEALLARRRLRLLSVGALTLDVALLLAVLPSRSAGLFLAQQVLGLTSGCVFIAGFTLPVFLRRRWRAAEFSRFQDAQAALMMATTGESVGVLILPHAADVLGGNGAVITGSRSTILASYDLDEAECARIAALAPALPGAESFEAPDGVGVRLRDGWLIVRTSSFTPALGRDELMLLQGLGHLADLALTRVESADREREARHQTQEREHQLAEAQRLAHLGSYEWDIESHEATWSDEMYRIYAIEPGTRPDMDLFMSRVHPDDAHRVTDATAVAMRLTEPFTVDYRIVLPNGVERWVQGMGRPVPDERGRVSAIVGTVRDVTDQKRAEAELEYQALHDPLTGLPNRLLLTDRLTQALGRSRRTGRTLAVLFLDLDRFKLVNDGFGHSSGDELLRIVARRLDEAMRPTDTVARMGGDEFVVLVEELDGVEEAIEVAERIRIAVALPAQIDGREVAVSASIGMVLGDDEHGTPEVLLRDADAAMYRAKDLGRARLELFDQSLRDTLLARIETERALAWGIDNGELELHYQPSVSLDTGTILGVEALVRWRRGSGELVPPTQFIPLAEETGLISALGNWVLVEACRQARRWTETLPVDPEFVMWVNLSGHQVAGGDLPGEVATILAETGLAASHLGLELTESVFMDNARVGDTVQRLKAMGVKLAIDDFGTGFSSLGYLKRFPVDMLKVDRSFVSGVTEGGEDAVIVRACVTLAHALGLTPVAEGVETPEQLAALRELGCDQAQGYLFGRPMPAEQIAAVLAGAPVCEPDRLRVLVCDDEPAIRTIFRLAFEAEGALVVEAPTGEECVRLAAAGTFDLIVLDLRMPGHDGLWTLRELRRKTSARVLLVTAAAAGDAVDQAMSLGADACLDKVDFLDRLPLLLHAANAAA